MRSLLITLLSIGAASVFAHSVPLTTKEVGLMLRSGYSSDAVMKELGQRHFAGSLDPEVEKQLTQAGASEALLDALRRGIYRASDEEVAAAAQSQLVEEEKHAAEESEKTSEPRGSKQNSTTVTRQDPPATPARGKVVYQFLKGDLVWWHQDSVTQFDDEALEQKKFYLFFFSANWSAPARKFTSELIEYYNRTATAHPEFEVIFFSADRSQFGMETYLGQSRMPWPAVAYPQIAAKTASMDVRMVHDIPALVLVDAGGRILSSTGGNDKQTPQQVLAQADKVLAQSDGAAVARAR